MANKIYDFKNHLLAHLQLFVCLKFGNWQYACVLISSEKIDLCVSSIKTVSITLFTSPTQSPYNYNSGCESDKVISKLIK